jgi:hypothetical protein
MQTAAIRLSLAPRAVAAASLLAALAACGLFKGNEEVQAIVNKRVIGMSVGDFFDRYGRPRTRSEKADGGMEYDWISAVPFARPGVEGLDERVCKLALTSDRRGRIDSVVVRYDAQGMKSTSRCGEIFSEG